MKYRILLMILTAASLFGCQSVGQPGSSRGSAGSPASTASPNKAPRNSASVIHVFVALCDNVNQGIVPVSASLGNGDNPRTNLYWGAAFGVKTFFGKHKHWQPVSLVGDPKEARSYVLDRLVFKHRERDAFLVADAYRGIEIKRATQHFLEAAAGTPGETINVSSDGKTVALHLAGSAQLIAYVGHDGLMDFQLTSSAKKRDDEKRDAIILACASKSYFAEALRKTGANPLLWTTNLMAPEAYVLSAAIDGWLGKESDEQIRVRAVKAYHQYQNCGLGGANRLFATGW